MLLHNEKLNLALKFFLSPKNFARIVKLMSLDDSGFGSLANALDFIEEFLCISESIPIEQAISFEVFKSYWKESKCRFIHLFRFNKNEEAKVHIKKLNDESFIVPVYQFLIKYLKDPNLEICKAAWVFYSLYVLYFTQVTETKYPIPFVFEYWPNVMEIIRKLKALNASECLKLVNRLHEKAFEFVYGVANDDNLGILPANLPFEEFKEQYKDQLSLKPLSEEGILDKEKFNRIANRYVEASSSIGSDNIPLENPIKKFLDSFDQVTQNYDELLKSWTCDRAQGSKEEGDNEESSSMDFPIDNQLLIPPNPSAFAFLDLGSKSLADFSSDEENEAPEHELFQDMELDEEHKQPQESESSSSSKSNRKRPIAKKSQSTSKKPTRKQKACAKSGEIQSEISNALELLTKSKKESSTLKNK
jgi:hypothetical protein